MRDEAKKQIILISNDIRSNGMNVLVLITTKTLEILFLYGSLNFLCSNEN